MKSDEQEIRELFDNWIKSTTEGDLDLARTCIADDALFIGPGPSHSLSIVEKRDGRWQIVRDANTLVSVKE